MANVLRRIVATTLACGHAWLLSALPARAALVSYWNFDSAAAPYADTAPGGGTADHGTVGGTAPSQVAGVFSNGLHFAGNGTLNVGSSADFDLTNYTVSAWLYVDAGVTGWRTAMGSWFNPYWMHFGKDSGAVWGDYGGAQTSGGTVNTAQWYHVASVRGPGAGGLQLWVNGALVATNTGTTSIPGANNVFLASKDGTNNLWFGNMDDLALWDSPLTATGSGKVRALYTVPTSGLAGLSAYDAAAMNTLFGVYDSGTPATVGSRTWSRITDLTGHAAGDVWAVGNVYFLQLGASDGLRGTLTTYTWDADPGAAGAQDGSGAWDTNWWDGAANVTWPNDGSQLAFIGSGAGAAGTITVTGTQNLGGISFSSAGSGNYTVSGGTLALSGPAPTIWAGAGLSPTLASCLAGNGASLTKSGTGTLTLTATNTYTGTTTINGGTLQLGDGTAGSDGTLGGSNVVVGGATLAFNCGGSQTVTNTITGTATPTLIKSGNGTITLYNTGAVSFGSDGTGNLIVNGGTLKFSGLAHNTGLYQTGIVITAAGALEMDVGAGIHNALGGWFTTLSGTGTLLKTGPGTLNPGIYAGKRYVRFDPGAWINIQGGTLRNDNLQVDWSGNMASLKVASGAVLDLRANSITLDALTGDGLVQNSWLSSLTESGIVGYTLTVGANNGSGTFAGVIRGSLTNLNEHIGDAGGANGLIRLVKTGSGTQVLTGVNTYGGSTTLTGGTLLFAGLQDQALAGAVSGSGRLVQQGPGALTFAAGIHCTGGVTVSGGTLFMGGSNGAAVVIEAGGTLEESSSLSVAALTIQGGGTVSAFRAGTNAILSVLQADGLALDAVGTGVVRLVNMPLQAGSFPIIDYNGSIQGGTVETHLTLAPIPPRMSAALTNNAINTSVDLVVTDTGEPIRWTGASGTNWDIAASTNWLTQNTLAATTYQESGPFGDRVIFDDSAASFAVHVDASVAPYRMTVNNSTNNYTLQGAGIGGPVTLVKSGSGSLTIAGAGNTYAGGTSIEAGLLRLAQGDDRLPTNGVVSLAGSGTLDLNDRSQTLCGLAGSGRVALGAGTLTLADPATNGLFSGTIGGSGNVIKAGAGTLTLDGSGANTHTGMTTVAAGRLVLAKTSGVNAIGGDLTINTSSGWNANGVRLASDEQIADGAVLHFTGADWCGFFPMGRTETVAGLDSPAGKGVIENSTASQGSAGGDGAVIVNAPAGTSCTFNGYIRDTTATDGTKLSLTKAGAGTQTLVGAFVTYSGNTTVTGGTLAFSSTPSLATPAISNAATVRFIATNLAAWAVARPLIGDGIWEVDGDGQGDAGQSRVIFRMTNNTSSGGIRVVNHGKFWLDRGVNAIGDSTVVDIAASAGFYLYSSAGSDTIGTFQVAETIGGLTGRGVVYGVWAGGTNPPALTVGGGDVSASFSGAIGEAGTLSGLRLIKSGAGTQTLSGPLAHGGETTISGGALVINGTKAGTNTVTVGTGGTLGGTGTVAGVVSVLSGGHVAPGPGKLTLTSGLTLADGAALDFDLGADSDQLLVTGGAFTGASAGGVVIAVADAGGLRPGWYVLVDWTGAKASGVDVNDFVLSFPSGRSEKRVLIVQPGRLILIVGSGGLLMVR